MKTIIYKLYLILFIVGLFQSVYSQLNPATNAFDFTIDTGNVRINNIIQTNTTGINCSTNTFFAITTLGDINEYTIVGNTINFIQTVATGSGKALAYCNNLNGGAFSPTFYSSNQNLDLIYFDGVNWITFTGGTMAANAGGFQNNLYYHYLNTIYKYNGINLAAIYSLPNGNITAADLAVDNSGNIWISKGTNSATPATSDTINVISPTGQLIKQFPFNYNNMINAYGTFLLNDVLYIGFGSGNPTIPNTLLPITFNNDSSILGSPINFPGDFIDLASCDPGSPFIGIQENKLFNFTIAPNPFTSETIITFSEFQMNITVNILDVMSREIKKIKFKGKELLIEKEQMKEGIYFIQILDENKHILIKKIIIL